MVGVELSLFMLGSQQFFHKLCGTDEVELVQLSLSRNPRVARYSSLGLTHHCDLKCPLLGDESMEN